MLSPAVDTAALASAQTDTETAYDPLAVDAYAEHLTEVNEVKDVIASEDIRNKQGMLLIKKGQPISRDMIDRIVQVKLLRPLEDSIDIDDALTPQRILDGIEDLVTDALRIPYEQYQLRREIQHCCNAFFRYPILVQKLTVLSLQMPHEYKKSLCVACIGMLIALRIGMSPEERADLFIAALIHDIGMLHIPRDIIDKQEGLTTEEWRAIQGHVVIGQQILKQIKGMSPSIARAVLEHHEFCDGTGYPLGRFGADLSQQGQIVGVVDCIFVICNNKLIPKNIGVCHLLPILQIDAHIYHQNVGNAMIQLLRELDLPETHWIEPSDNARMMTEMIADAAFLGESHAALTRMVEALPADHNPHDVHAARELIAHLDVLLRRSGILDEGHFSELQRLAGENADVRTDIEDTQLMLQELRWQLQRLTRILHAAAENTRAPLPAPVCAALKQDLEALPSLGTENPSGSEHKAVTV